jgi:hypothetical protein
MEPMIKGYCVRGVAQHILVTSELLQRLDPAVRLLAEQAAKGGSNEWRPRAQIITLLRAIASLHDNDEGARRALMAAGHRVGQGATNTFLRLLLKVLTPKIFAAKIPDFYKRDHRGGHIDIVDLKDKSLHLRINDIAGFDHMAPLSAGWMSQGLSAMGVKLISVSATPWSLDSPAPPTVDFVAHWQ